MSYVVDLVLFPLTTVFTVLNAFFALQCLVGSRLPHPPVPPASRRLPAAILIPAHNEEAAIATVIRSLRPQMLEGDRLVVIADNCEDDTARIAAGTGAEVVVRVDELRRGKAYALDAGLRHIASDPRPVVVMIDADCVAAPDALHHLVTEVERSARPVQGRYLMVAASTRRPQDRLAEFAFLIKNRIRPLGLSRLGLGCQLTGSGMAFPYACLAQVNFRHSHLVEDLKLGIELASKGLSPRYCDAAILTSPFPLSKAGLHSQRQRWEKGRLQLAATVAGMLLVPSTYRSLRLVLLLVDALVPPVILLAAALAILTAVAGFAAFLGSAAWPFLLLLTSTLALAGALACAWWTQGRNILPGAALRDLPAFILARMSLYPRLLLDGPGQWIRTSRSPEDA